MKKTGNVITENTIYIVLLVLAFILMFLYIGQQSNGASLWEDYYAKEISRTINLASPADEISLDIHKATEIAQKNKVSSLSEIFTFNNEQNQICVKLSTGKQTCYNYFNEVDVIKSPIKLASGSNGETNILTLKIVEAQK